MLERITDEIGHSWFALAVTLAAELETSDEGEHASACEREQRERERERFEVCNEWK